GRAVAVAAQHGRSGERGVLRRRPRKETRAMPAPAPVRRNDPAGPATRSEATGGDRVRAR
ncbi:hypothetical protein, partial [Streptomyces collinus]